MNSILLQLLSDDNKSWHEANNDLLLIAILLEKHFSYQGINESFYRQVLNESLYDLCLSNDDISELKTELMKMFRSDSAFTCAIANILSAMPDIQCNLFLLDELKKNYCKNPALAVAIIRTLREMEIQPDSKLLYEMYQYTTDEALRSEIKASIDYENGRK